MPEPDALRWHDDGHQLWLQLVRADLTVATVLCPHATDDDGPCRSRQAECVVRYFIDRFGLECNVGTCAPEEYLDVAWSLVGNADDLDLAQVWIIPTSDDVFASWRATQS
jgi:hypothetical protein